MSIQTVIFSAKSKLVTSLNGSGVALKEVVDMAAQGRIKSLLDRYPLIASLASSSTATELYETMLSLYPNRVNPGSLWAAAKATKPTPSITNESQNPTLSV
jgi:hypothetical protein